MSPGLAVSARRRPASTASARFRSRQSSMSTDQSIVRSPARRGASRLPSVKRPQRRAEQSRATPRVRLQYFLAFRDVTVITWQLRNVIERMTIRMVPNLVPFREDPVQQMRGLGNAVADNKEHCFGATSG